MARIDDTIATYLTAIEVEGKTQNTVLSYRASLEDFRRVGRRLGFPEELAAYSVEHVYRFLGDLKQRGASPAYQHRRHREVKTFFFLVQADGVRRGQRLREGRPREARPADPPAGQPR